MIQERAASMTLPWKSTGRRPDSRRRKAWEQRPNKRAVPSGCNSMLRTIGAWEIAALERQPGPQNREDLPSSHVYGFTSCFRFTLTFGLCDSAWRLSPAESWPIHRARCSVYSLGMAYLWSL